MVHIRAPAVHPSADALAAQHLVQTAGAGQQQVLPGALAFTHEVGYPVIVKPDNGVGAIATWKLQSDEDTVAFFSELPPVPYLMEEYVTGVVTTYDGVCDSRGEVLFAASHITRNSIMDMVNEGVPTYYYVDKEVLGKRGDIVALKVNMRLTGGFTPDMLNFSQSTDVYQIWADMVAFDELRHTYDGPHFYCIYAGRRDENHYQLSLPQLQERCGSHARLFTRMPDALAGTMGNQVAIACFDTLEEVDDFVRTAFALAED